MVILILFCIIGSAVIVGILFGCGALFLRVNDYFWIRKEIRMQAPNQVTKVIFPRLEQFLTSHNGKKL